MDSGRLPQATAWLMALGLAFAGLYGCRREEPLRESLPEVRTGWADPHVLVEEHPLYAQLHWSQETAGSVAVPPTAEGPSGRALEDQYDYRARPHEGVGLEEWGGQAAATLDGAEEGLSRYESPVVPNAQADADALLAAQWEKISGESAQAAEDLDRDIAAGRLERQGRGAASDWAQREARARSARLRAKAMDALEDSAAERDRHMADAAADEKTRKNQRQRDLAAEKEDLRSFMKHGAAGEETGIGIATGRTAAAETAMVSGSQETLRDHESYLSAEGDKLQAAHALLYEKMLEDTKDMARRLAARHRIELSFDRGPVDQDVTAEVVELLRRAYSVEAPEIVEGHE